MLCTDRVYLCTLLTEVASEGWNKPAYSIGLKRARLMSGCVHCDTRHAETLQIDDERETWWNWQNFSDSLCGELLVGLLLGVAKDGREHFLCGKAAWSQQWLQPSVVNAKWDRQKKGFKIYVWLPWETRLRYAIRLCCFIVEVRNCRRTDFPNFWWTVCKAVLMTFGPPPPPPPPPCIFCTTKLLMNSL